MAGGSAGDSGGGDESWLIGVGLAVVASVVSNLGLNLQKLTHVRLQAAAAARAEGDEEEAAAGGGEAAGAPRGGKEDPGWRHRVRRLSALPAPEPYGREAALAAAAAEIGAFDASSPPPGPRGSPAGADSEAAYATEAGGRIPARARDLTDRMLVRREAEPEPEPYYKQPMWLLGFAGVVLGSLLDFAALAFTAQSVVAPLGALTLLVNIYMAPYLSGEKVTRRDVKATVLIVVGSATSVVFGAHTDANYSFDEFFEFFTRWKFVVYGTFILTCVSFSVSIFAFFDRLRDDLRFARRPTVVEARRRLKGVMRVLLGGVAGIIGAQSILFAKASAQLVRIGVLKLWTHWQSYLVLAGLVLSIQGQVQYLNKGLERYDALAFVPIFEAFWIAGGVVSGLVVFDEAENFTFSQTIGFSLGVWVTLFGVSLLAGRKGSANEDRYSDLQGAPSPRSSYAGSDCAGSGSDSDAELPPSAALSRSHSYSRSHSHSRSRSRPRSAPGSPPPSAGAVPQSAPATGGDASVPLLLDEPPEGASDC